MCPIGGKLFPQVFPRKVICHCLLVESKDGLILIDTGFAKSVLESPRSMGLLYPFLGLNSPVEDAAVQQIQRLGFAVEDVRHLIPTHLDNDHAGAVVDFPLATVHTSKIELEAAQFPKSLVGRVRYRQFLKPKDQKWQEHIFDRGERWFGFDGVRAIPGTDDEVLLVPLFGHTPGHFAVAVNTGDRWLLHVGDAYYNHSELTIEKTFGLKAFQWIVHSNYRLAMQNQLKLADLHRNHGDEIQIFCAHDPEEMPIEPDGVVGRECQ